MYRIGRFEITAGQYTEFLNAVAAEDTYGLYNAEMWSSDYGCKIQQSGAPGSYVYSVDPDWADRPVNYVSWGDAARFVNWLHNGQPMGQESLATTEDGSYFLNGALEADDLMAIMREPDATWVIPSEDEWYKAAYHKNNGITGDFWNQPTCRNAVPGNDVVDPDPGNQANYWIFPEDYSTGAPYWRTQVGEFENSASPYGTYDQCGNVWEWIEGIDPGTLPLRGVRGGAFSYHAEWFRAAVRVYEIVTDELDEIGFRVAKVAPASCAADVDVDGDTDLADLAELLGNYEKCPGEPGYNSACNLVENDPPDGCIDLDDLEALLLNYGCPE